ncbi:MAG TPA: hypothetical protein VHW02_09800 [Rhizomicrobium sp.]|jgi:hypothetical protein|nr:hypothetical protein [Rhizomicrobium sp.]
MKRPFVAAAALLLAACASHPEAPPPPQEVTKIKTQVVRVRVPVSVPTQVQVNVPVYCKPDLGQAPKFADSNEALFKLPHSRARGDMMADPNDTAALRREIANLNYQVSLLLIGRLQHIQWEKAQTAALKGCLEPPP